jgi:hypothetical protein
MHGGETNPVPENRTGAVTGGPGASMSRQRRGSPAAGGGAVFRNGPDA